MDQRPELLVTVGGHSMEPTTRLGDQVRVCRDRRVRIGDVALFQADGQDPVLHRVVFRLPGVPYLLHAGDHRGARVGLGRSDRIVGRAELPRRRPGLRDLGEGLACVAQALAFRARRALGLR